MARNASLPSQMKLDLSSISYTFNKKNYTYKYILDYKPYNNVFQFMFN